ncbi:MAG: hypothetical protein DCC75_02840 [Proteobacteria bacterium]|nr:MAG: hypothetical protein DCC75_02840 [Pseudomonadota bacterium]
MFTPHNSFVSPGLVSDTSAHRSVLNQSSNGIAGEEADLSDNTAMSALTMPSPVQKPDRTASEHRSTFHEVITDLRSVGVTPFKLIRESLRDVSGEVLRWGSNLVLFGLGLEAAADHSSAAFVYLGIWAGLTSMATWCDRTSRTRVDEFDRCYSRALKARILNRLGECRLNELNDPACQARMELHHSRIDDLSNLTERSVALPGLLTKFTLSLGALLWADVKLAAVLGAAILPGILLRNRQAREDIKLEEDQSRQAKVIDCISDEAYSGQGSARMILGRMTGRIQHSIDAIQSALDKEKNAHERRQARQQCITDTIYYLSICGGLAMLYAQYNLGVFGIGTLSFLCYQLTDLALDLDDKSDDLQIDLDLAKKAGSFYRFCSQNSLQPGLEFPDDHTLEFQGVSFARKCENGDSVFSVSVPDFQLTPGDFLVIHGANGAGKTTLQKSIAFAARPEAGELLVGGLSAPSIDFGQWRDAIAYCGAAPALLQGLSVSEALSLDPQGMDHLTQRFAHPLIKDLIGDPQLGCTPETRIGVGIDREFSSGELQRLPLVCALIPRRKILILDEITSNQSDDFIKMIENEIAEQRRQGTTVILVTHREAFDESASHILFVSRGVGELRKSPPAVIEPLKLPDADLSDGTPEHIVPHDGDKRESPADAVV